MKDPELLLTDQIKNKNDYTGYVPFPSTHEKKERTVKPKQNKTNLKKQRYMKLRNSKDTTEWRRINVPNPPVKFDKKVVQFEHKLFVKVLFLKSRL